MYLVVYPLERKSFVQTRSEITLKSTGNPFYDDNVKIGSAVTCQYATIIDKGNGKSEEKLVDYSGVHPKLCAIVILWKKFQLIAGRQMHSPT